MKIMLLAISIGILAVASYLAWWYPDYQWAINTTGVHKKVHLTFDEWVEAYYIKPSLWSLNDLPIYSFNGIATYCWQEYIIIFSYFDWLKYNNFKQYVNKNNTSVTCTQNKTDFLNDLNKGKL